MLNIKKGGHRDLERYFTLIEMDFDSEDGRIAEQGSHEVLLAQNGEYASLWRTQNGKA